ncbi:hypothetical protein FACS1894132_00440 [Clostridia bacterium]|nr:hypothetical protein FACS1894132_00440 [Clostridia bacterium]
MRKLITIFISCVMLATSCLSIFSVEYEFYRYNYWCADGDYLKEYYKNIVCDEKGNIIGESLSPNVYKQLFKYHVWFMPTVEVEPISDYKPVELDFEGFEGFTRGDYQYWNDAEHTPTGKYTLIFDNIENTISAINILEKDERFTLVQDQYMHLNSGVSVPTPLNLVKSISVSKLVSLAKISNYTPDVMDVIEYDLNSDGLVNGVDFSLLKRKLISQFGDN